MVKTPKMVASFVFAAFLIATATAVEQVGTGGSWQYQWLGKLSGRQGFVTFDLKATRDAFITLSPTITNRPGQADPDAYTIMLGAFGNAKACMNTARAICLSEHAERGVLHGGQFRSFWVSWNNGLVQVGKGCAHGRNWMMEYRYPTKVPHVVNIGIRTQGTVGTWRYGDRGCTNNYGTGGPAFAEHAAGLTFNTPDYGAHKLALIHLDPAKHTMITFDVTAPNDVGIVLAADRQRLHENHYRIDLGAHKNTQTCLGRTGGPHCIEAKKITNFLKKDKPNRLWITFKKGVIEVGRGEEYNSMWSVMIHRYVDPNPIDVTAVGIRTIRGATGFWKFQSVTEAPVEPPNICPPVVVPAVNCPDREGGLIHWSPGNREDLDVVLEAGKYLLVRSASINTLILRNGGVLIFKDDPNNKIVLKTHHILIQAGGELHIGAERCKYKGKAEIQLVGKSTDPPHYEHKAHGRKFIAVERGGTLELHGEEKLSWTRLEGTLRGGVDDPIIQLSDDVSSWKPGDRVVIATTDFTLEQSEDLPIAPCPQCLPNQIKLKGRVDHTHYGHIYNGVDMRAEVGLLTRNVVVRGLVEDGCYGYSYSPNYCRFFAIDTFGGHMIFYHAHKSIHLSGIEVTNMGQQLKARYPIHFHLCDEVDEAGCYLNPAYVKGVSIHHVFDRCVTIHGTDGLLVEDVVAYETLGHCFFLEDGGEQRNVLRHNLAINVRHGTVEPSDRNTQMCTDITDWVWPGYKPDPNNCNAVSSFWISHPNNTFIDNVAAGSKGTGYWYIFRDAPSGPSEGKLPIGHISRSTIGKFQNNKATGHPRAGLMIDFGVKTDQPTASNPREFLSMGGGHYKPDTPAVLTGLTATKCDQGAWARGGNIRIEDSRFSDNVVGLTFASAGEMTVDGEHCSASRSMFVGRSPNVGNNDYFQRRTISGYRIYDGPIMVQQSTFTDFFPGGNRNDRTHAISFFGGPFQMTPKNQVLKLKYDAKTVRTRASPRIQRDAEKTEIFSDRDGSTTGYVNSVVINTQNYINRHEGCKSVPEWQALVCGGKHASLYVRRSNPGNVGTMLVRDEYPAHPMSLTGFGNVMHTVLLGTTYTLHFNGASPGEVILRMVNFDMGDYLRIGVCFGAGTTFDVYYETADRRDMTRKMSPAFTVEEVDRSDGLKYHWDFRSRLLFVKPVARLRRVGWWYYPEGYGTEQIRIKSHSPGGSGDCRYATYPRYSRSPRAIGMTPGGCTSNCGAPL